MSQIAVEPSSLILSEDDESRSFSLQALIANTKTWIKFKDYFKKAQQQLKAIRGPTMQQAGYHHANHLAQQMRTDNDCRDTELMSILSTAVDNMSVAPSMVESDVGSVFTPPPYQHQANAVQTDPVQLGMLKLLQQIS